MHIGVAAAGCDSQASFSERVAMGHISLGKEGFLSGKHGKGPTFGVLQISLTSVGARNTWRLGILMQEVVSKILAGIKAGRWAGGNKQKVIWT